MIVLYVVEEIIDAERVVIARILVGRTGSTRSAVVVNFAGKIFQL